MTTIRPIPLNPARIPDVLEYERRDITFRKN